jgi:hypothetical protein
LNEKKEVNEWMNESLSLSLSLSLLALSTKALKDIVFRFIIEYSSLRDFGP